jgi:ABC-type tungstate transport system substrate-binding protein
VLKDPKSNLLSKARIIATAGTVDPTSGLYNSTMCLMALLLAIALISNALMKPVDPRHHVAE